jgi:hypothetical protein
MRVISFIEDHQVIKKILKRLGLWEVKPRLPPWMTKTQPLFTEPRIDYSESQVFTLPTLTRFYEKALPMRRNKIYQLSIPEGQRILENPFKITLSPTLEAYHPYLPLLRA